MYGDGCVCIHGSYTPSYPLHAEHDKIQYNTSRFMCEWWKNIIRDMYEIIMVNESTYWIFRFCLSCICTSSPFTQASKHIDARRYSGLLMRSNKICNIVKHKNKNKQRRGYPQNFTFHYLGWAHLLWENGS